MKLINVRRTHVGVTALALLLSNVINSVYGHDEHDADDMAHQHASAPYSAESIANAATAGTDIVPLPSFDHHAGHGHHHGSAGPPIQLLNETFLFLAKGPDPLSYMEWDWNYGAARLVELQRFINNSDVLDGKDRMGAVDGRWRKLFDETSDRLRSENAKQIASRVKDGQEPIRHTTLLAFHVLLAVLSCFILLPVALVLRAAESNLAPLALLLYLVTLGGSMFLSMVYKALTPRLYPSNSHGGMGWSVFWISLICLGPDVFRLLGQIWLSIQSVRGTNQRWVCGITSWNNVFNTMLDKKLPVSSQQYDALEEEVMLSGRHSDVPQMDLEYNLAARSAPKHHPSGNRSPAHRVHFDQRVQGLQQEVHWAESGSTAYASSSHSRHGSHSESPVFSEKVIMTSPTITACNTPRNSMLGEDHLAPLNLKSISHWRDQTESCSANERDDVASLFSPSRYRFSTHPTRLQKWKSLVRYTHVSVCRSLPLLAFAASYTGIAVYTGSCRGGYKNVCLAHGIKGAIFFWYGLLTFARYLGVYADCGWAWNKRPWPQNAKHKDCGRRRDMPSAEFIECLVIFVYGATNTWMERFGSKPGDPYTIKQIQHISIAVMFWFAGLMGMLLETKKIRNLLSLPIAYHHAAAIPPEQVRKRRAQRGSRGVWAAREEDEVDLYVEAQTQPVSYAASFNPFPALVIGVTGVAMAAHHQDYLYEVEIHLLWGELLAGFSLLRCLTYFLLWLRPPTASVLPSRPPTEALAAFSLCCGGLVFMLSSEQVSFAAMRSGYGDFMAILNVAVAIVSLLFCWTTLLMLIKGWAVGREIRRTNIMTATHSLELEPIQEETELHGRRFKATVPIHAHDENIFVLDDEEESS